MKTSVHFLALFAAAGGLLAADATPKDALKAAAAKLADQSGYSWKSTVETAGGGGGGGGRMRPGPTDGKTEKGGFTLLNVTRGDDTLQVLLQGGKGAIKTPDGWVSGTEAAAIEDRQNPARFASRMISTYKVPAAEVTDLADKAKELKQDGGTVSGDLTEDGAKSLLSWGGRGGGAGGNGPTYSDAKGSVKFWIQDGSLTKYEVKIQGKVSFNGNDREVDRTTTTEVKDVGTTQVEATEEAKKKIS
jgi:hypothetical protein